MDISIQNATIGAFGDTCHSISNATNKARREDPKREWDEKDGTMSTYSTDESNSDFPKDPFSEKDDVMRKQYARIACDLSAHLVQAAIEAGACENVSAIVVLFGGLFNPK